MKSKERNFYLDDIPLEDAWNRLREALEAAEQWFPLSGESIPLTEACGRITAEPVWAKISSPHYYASAMDGYAVKAENTIGASETQPIRLQLEEDAHPVNTGDALPPESNAVVMIEHVQTLDGNRLEIRAPVAPWQHVRMMGEDIVATEMLLPASHKIRPVDIGSIAGCGHHEVCVRRRPYVIIIPTGSELVQAEQKPKPGQIIEYNSLILQAQLAEVGGQSEVWPVVSDDPKKLRKVTEDAILRKVDLLLILSGASAGSRDYTASIIREMGELLVHGIAVRPGHPVIMGMIKDIPVIGVPGYPVSAALTGELLVQRWLAQRLGISSTFDNRERVNAVMTNKIVSPTGDDDFVRVTLAQVGDQIMATPLKRGAGIITSLVRADGLVQIPRYCEGLDIGEESEVILYSTIDAIRKRVFAMGSHDPLLDLLGQYLAEGFPGTSLASANVGSMGGLSALRRRTAHLAGIHLLDEETGEYNISYVQKYFPNVPVRLITFAHREQGLIVDRGNPKSIQDIGDLSRIRYVNRQKGAGTRVLLDFELKKRGMSTGDIEGYSHEEYTHLSVAAAVATGMADCGMGVRRAAKALNLDFIPLCWERYDFVIPLVYLSHQGVRNLLDTLNSIVFKKALTTHPGYDTRETGRIQFEG